MKRDKLIDMFEGGRYQYLNDSKKLRYEQAKFRFINPNI